MDEFDCKEWDRHLFSQLPAEERDALDYYISNLVYILQLKPEARRLIVQEVYEGPEMKDEFRIIRRQPPSDIDKALNALRYAPEIIRREVLRRMGVSELDLPNSERETLREFAYEGRILLQSDVERGDVLPRTSPRPVEQGNGGVAPASSGELIATRNEWLDRMLGTKTDMDLASTGHIDIKTIRNWRRGETKRQTKLNQKKLCAALNALGRACTVDDVPK